MPVALTTLNAKYIHPSLALRIISNDLANHSIVHEVLEYNTKSDMEAVLEALSQYDILGISCYIYNINEILFLIEQLRIIKPEQIIILGGPEVSFVKKEELPNYQVDYIVCGEGEKVVASLIQTIINKETTIPSSVIDVKQEVMNTTQNQVAMDYAMPLTNDLEGIDIEHQIVYLETSRGCPYKCAYCQASLDNNMRNFNLDYVKAKIDEVLMKRVKLVKFLDRTFNFDVKRTNEIFNYIIENNNDYTTFQLEITGELLNESSIDLINDKAPAGLFRFEIGVQSTNYQANRAVRRYQDFAKLGKIVKKIKDGQKVVTHLDLIAGLPFEDLASFEKTFNEVFDLKPDELQLGFLKLLKGTHFNELVKEYQYEFDLKAPFEIKSNQWLRRAELEQIDYVEHALNRYYNNDKAKDYINYLVDVKKVNPFQLLMDLGKNLHRKMQIHDIYENLLNSKYTSEDDLKYLYLNYYQINNVRPKRLSHVPSKKDIFHILLEKYPVTANDVFNYGCIEKIEDNKYFIYLLNTKQNYELEI